MDQSERERVIEELGRRSTGELALFFSTQGLGPAFNSAGQGWGRAKRIADALAEAERIGQLEAVLRRASVKFRAPVAGQPGWAAPRIRYEMQTLSSELEEWSPKWRTSADVEEYQTRFNEALRQLENLVGPAASPEQFEFSRSDYSTSGATIKEAAYRRLVVAVKHAAGLVPTGSGEHGGSSIALDAEVQSSAKPHPLFRKVAMPGGPTQSATKRQSDKPATVRVFVVHGRAHGPRDAVARVLAQLGLEAVILEEQPNRGRTLIEKFERYADVEYAVVVLTPDDVGGLAGGPRRPRARQNVVLELGFFLGKLGRDRVAAIVVGDVEQPADVSGVVYITYDASGGWKTKLGHELREAGLQIDLNKVR